MEVAKAVWRGDYTYLDHTAINGGPEAVVLAEPTPDRGGPKKGRTTTPGQSGPSPVGSGS